MSNPESAKKQLHIKLADSDYQQLQHVSTQLGLTVSDYVRYVLRKQTEMHDREIRSRKRRDVVAMGAVMKAMLASDDAERTKQAAVNAWGKRGMP